MSSPRSLSAQLIHDMRNGLFVIEASARSLPMIRTDAAEFASTHGRLTRQIDEMRQLVIRAEALLSEGSAAGG